MSKFIVYIDDEEFQAKLFTRIIEDQVKDVGMKVKTFTKAKEAEEYLTLSEAKEVFLVLVDLSMYEVSGFDMINKIRKINPNLKIAVLTSHEDKNIEREARKLGIEEYFVKNGDLKELDRLRKFFVNTILQS